MNLKKELIKHNKPTNNNHNKITKEITTEINTIESVVIETTLNKLFMTMKNTEHLEEVRVGLHASSIIASDEMFCYREQVLSLLYHQQQGSELSIPTLRIFAAGVSIHEKWQNMFQKSGIVVKNEARSFAQKYDLYFTPDSIIKINNKEYVVEIKSMNTYSFKNAKSHPSGQKQCMLYMHLLGIENGFVLAEDKNTQEIKIFPVTYDYKKILPFIDRLNEIQVMKKAFIENKEVPPRKCSSSNCKRAEECNMRAVCFGDKETRSKLKL